MTNSKLPFKHILVVAPPAWGHLRPLISLSCKLIKERPDIIITLPTAGDFNVKLGHEIERYFHKDDEDLKNNIRLLHLGEFGAMVLVDLFNKFYQAFNDIYPAIYEGKPVQCLTGETYPATTRPDVILLDPFLLPVLREIRKISGSTIPVLAWNSASLPSMLRFFAPQALSGLGNLPQKAEEIVKATGKPLTDIIIELSTPRAGEVIEIPGLPAMYDYEFNGQHVDPMMAPFLGEVVFRNGYRFFQECDGIVAVGNTAFEPKIHAAYTTWFAPRPVYFIGPLMPEESSHSQQKELNGSSNGSEVLNFLNVIQNSHGDYSLLYISFGSVFWPLGETVWKLLELVLDMKIPLILSLNPRIEMPSHLQARVKASELVLVSSWAPQHAILSHRATGFFLTHCGNNSVNEAVSHGVPMIAWPLAADQYVNAAYMSSTLNIAYELFETRIKDGLRPLCRGVKPVGTVEAATEELRSVLTRAWGIDGIRKRENIHALQKKVNSAWNEDGEARRELRHFLDKFVPLD